SPGAPDCRGPGRGARRARHRDVRAPGVGHRRAHAPRRPRREAPDASPPAARGWGDEPDGRRAGDLRQLLWLLRTYPAPYWSAVALLLVSSYVATAVAALFPVLMA